MSQHTGPRPNSRPFKALALLSDVGGRLNKSDLASEMNWTESRRKFQVSIIDVLAHFLMVVDNGPEISILPAGLRHLGKDAKSTTCQPAVVAGPRYVPPQRPLSSKYQLRIPGGRPGALDYQSAPSRIGDARIPHGVKAVDVLA